MSTLARLLGFAVVLALVFAAAALAGAAVGPDPQIPAAHEAAREAPTRAPVRSAEHDARGGGGHTEPAPAAGAARPTAEPAGAPEAAPPGLAVAAGGYRLGPERTRFARGTHTVRFRILDAEGAPVTRFEVAHTKRLHLIVVRRDLARFVHRHPTMAADGTWSVRLRLPKGGTYRLFADFTREGRQRTLGTDLQVGGSFAPVALPAVSTEAVSDGGLRVTLRSERLTAGLKTPLRFEVRDGSRLVDSELEPHLGARGHLVALRAGDLAYLHTHPDADALRFASAWPTPGRYRLWVQFRYRGRIHTAAFTQEVSP